VAQIIAIFKPPFGMPTMSGNGQRAEVRAVFFDIGGTLIHPDPSFAALLARVCRDHGLPVEPSDAERAEPAVWARIAKRTDAGRGFSLSPDRSHGFWLWVYQVFIEELGYGHLGRSDLPQRLFNTFTRMESYRLYDDARPTLARLRSAGYTLGVISNWEQWLGQLMLHLEIASYFDVTIVSGVAGFEKPDPRIFLRALADTGVGPEAAAHVGDSPHDDVEGARRVGMLGVLLDRSDRFAPVIPKGGETNSVTDGESQPATPRIQSLLELPGLLGLPSTS
jgi:putative hydrolase of the HAD superfamily